MPPAQKKGKGAEAEPTVLTGKLWLPNGDRYEGEYVEDPAGRRRQGRGVYTAFCAALLEDESCPLRDAPPPQLPPPLPHDILEWDGTWEADAFCAGRLAFADGSSYEGPLDAQGQFVSGGRYTWPNGCWYEGDWRGNVIHGSGRFSGLDGVVLEGVYRNGSGPGLADVEPGESETEEGEEGEAGPGGEGGADGAEAGASGA